jgi:hypothetical protein
MLIALASLVGRLGALLGIQAHGHWPLGINLAEGINNKIR